MSTQVVAQASPHPFPGGCPEAILTDEADETRRNPRSAGAVDNCHPAESERKGHSCDPHATDVTTGMDHSSQHRRPNIHDHHSLGHRNRPRCQSRHHRTQPLAFAAPHPSRTSRTTTTTTHPNTANQPRRQSRNRPNQPLNVPHFPNATTLPVAVPRLPKSGRHARPCEVRRRSPQPPRKPSPVGDRPRTTTRQPAARATTRQPGLLAQLRGSEVCPRNHKAARSARATTRQPSLLAQDSQDRPHTKTANPR
jgi:hypothetical protein